MKSQISRDSFRPEARYSGVYLQQGRMILDADWNELTDIQKARLVDALRHAVGGGAPRDGGLSLGVAAGRVRIAPGTLYVDGMPARIDPAGGASVAIPEQADYPLPLPVKDAYADSGRRFYADVWERQVTALEDDRLLDPGLHGADTATRSQTMLQVKWCAKSRNPLAETDNPTIGNASLSLALRSIVSDGDACNPCAVQVSVDERIGNYLFRVEVHDYNAASGWLTLKWSRDNGAESCAADARPPGFGQGDWVWEFFDRDTERLLGNHLDRAQDWAADYFPGANPTASGYVAAPLKFRGVLRESASLPAAPPAIATSVPSAFLRQWDGYLRINLASQALHGIDRGVALFAGAAGDDGQRHGRVFLDDDLYLNLERLRLVLSIKDRRFVAGDYWLAEVREANDGSGDVVLSAAPPRGVRHRYLYLGELDGTTLKTGELDGAGNLIADSADAYRRRMHFPPLTDLRAEEIGFTDRCDDLFEGAQNVQEALDKLCHIAADNIAFTDNCGNLFDGATDLQAALDNLCHIAADDIAYRLPDCSPNNGKSIRDRLRATLDPDGDGKLSVEAALDNLLCRLDASQLPYQVPDCAGTPSVRSLLQVAVGDNNVGPILTKLLCEFKANDLPLDKTEPGLCVELKAPGIDTVQDALDLLCKTPASCALTVAVGQLERILRDFAARQDYRMIWLCLQPGEHPIAAPIELRGKAAIRLSAVSAGTARIRLSGGATLIEAGEIVFEQVGWNVDAGSTLTLRGQRIRSEGCDYARAANLPNLPPMVELQSWDLGLQLFNITPELFWRDNTMRDSWLRFVPGKTAFAPEFTGEAVVSGRLAELLGDQAALLDPEIFGARVKVAAESIAAMSAAQIDAWSANLGATSAAPRRRSRAAAVDTGGAPLAVPLSLDTAMRSPDPRALAIPLGRIPLAAPAIDVAKLQVAGTVSQIKAAAGNVGIIAGLLAGAIVATVIERGFGVALALADNLLSGSLCDNHVEGEIELKNGLGSGGGDFARGGLAAILRTPGLTVSGSLALSGNRIRRLWARLPAATIDTADGIWHGRLNGYQSLALNGNEFAAPENSVVAASFSVQGNRFHGNETTAFRPTGVLFGSSVVVSGNTSGFNNTLAPLIVATTAFAEAANLVKTKALLTT